MNISKVEFLSQLFRIPTYEILEWNAIRTKPDQKQLIHFLNSLFKFYCNETSPSSSQPSSKQARPIRSDCENQCDSESLTDSSSLRSSVKSHISSWLRDTCEVTSVGCSTTTGSAMTRFSSLSTTTANSTIVFPRSSQQRDYAKHTRGFAINRRSWSPIQNVHPSTESSPIFPPQSFSINRTRRRESFEMSDDLIRRVFHERLVPIVGSFLKSMTPEKKSDFLRVIMAVDSLGRLSHFDTSNRRHFIRRSPSKMRAVSDLGSMMIHDR